MRPILAGRRRDALPEGWQDTQKRWPLGNWQLSSPCFSSLGFRGSLWKVPSWYHFDRIPSCWPFLLSCAFCGLQRSLELSSSKQESLGTKPPNFCLKLISPTPVEFIGDLCASAEQVVLQKNLKAGGRAPGHSTDTSLALSLKKERKSQLESFMHLIVWEFCETCACQLNSSFLSHACHIHQEPVCHSFWNDATQMLWISLVSLGETHARLHPCGW